MLGFKINKNGILWRWMTFRFKSFESHDCFVRIDIWFERLWLVEFVKSALFFSKSFEMFIVQ